MKVEAYTELGRAVTLCRNKENSADCLLLFRDRESDLNNIIIHICKHDLIELSKTIQSFCVDSTSKEKTT